GRYLSLLALLDRPFSSPAPHDTHVYPNLEAVHRYHLLARANQLGPLGARQVRLRVGNAAFESLRAYLRGGDARLIVWKATASDHGRCVRLVSARHPKRALVVLLTDFVDTQTAGDMIAYLRETSPRHLVLFVALKDPFLERAARARVETPREGFRKAAAVDL